MKVKKSAKKFKYILNSLYKPLQDSEKERITLELRHYGIPYSTFIQYCNITENSPKSIPGDKIEILEKVFNVDKLKPQANVPQA